MITSWRHRLKGACWVLVWLTGLALIIGYAPAGYRWLKLADGERVIGFRGPTHELITVSGGPTGERPAALHNLLGSAPPPFPGASFESTLVRQRYLDISAGPTNLGDTIHLWDLDSDKKVSPALEGPVEIYRVMSCADGTRLFVDYRLKSFPAAVINWRPDTGRRIAVVDGQSARSLRTIYASEPAGLLSASADGKVMAMLDPVGVSCLDDTGPLLHSAPGMTDAIVSPNGNYVALTGFGEEAGVIDLKQGRRVVDGSSLGPLLSFSPRSDRLNDGGRAIRDMAANTVIYQAPHPCIFVDDGKKVAWAEDFHGRLRIRFRDIDAERDVMDCDFSIPGKFTALEAVDSRGDLVRLNARGPAELTPVEKVLNWLGLKRTSPQNETHQWLLIDAKSGQLLDQGRDELIAASADGRYVIAGENYQTRLQLHELPLRRSMTFMAIAGAVWTMFLLVCRRWWARRLKSLLTDAIEPVPAAV